MRFSMHAGCLTLAICAAAALPAASQTTKPQVYAAWSQIIGEADPQKADRPANPAVELRFAVNWPTGAVGQTVCDAFRVSQPGAAPGIVTTTGETPTVRPQILTGVAVCRQRIDGMQAQLYHADGSAVRLVSSMNLGSHHWEMLDQGHWTPGPSDNALVVVAGPDWIGRGAALNIVTLGDTGCKGGHEQQCDTQLSGKKSWPLRNLARVAADQAPDLVVHVGDYRYFRESDPDMRNDSWLAWQKDFFPVAQPLLLAAPWAFARGNHEGCPTNALRKYGAGYFQFFGQNDTSDCAHLSGIYRDPWYFDVNFSGGSAAQAHRFVMLDANDYQGSAGVDYDQAFAHFQNAVSISRGLVASSWWVWHSPAVQRINYHPEAFGDATLRKALLEAAGFGKSGGRRFCFHHTQPGCRPSMFLLGHQHLYQDVTFIADQNPIFPQATVVGHGGVAIRSSSPAPDHGQFCDEGDFPLGADGAQDVEGLVETVEEHGLVVWTRSSATQNLPVGWSPRYLWTRNVQDNGGTVSGTFVPDTVPTLPVAKCLAP